MISYLLFLLKSSLHAKVAVIAWAIFTAIAVTEAFQGQLIIALIAALPPTAAVVVALIALLKGQKQMQVSMDGKLSELIKAKGEVAHAAGAKEERNEERARVEAVTVLPAKIEIINAKDNPVPVSPVGGGPNLKKDEPNSK